MIEISKKWAQFLNWFEVSIITVVKLLAYNLFIIWFIANGVTIFQIIDSHLVRAQAFFSCNFSIKIVEQSIDLK